MKIRTILFVIIALIIQYVYLKGSLVALPNYQSSSAFSEEYKSVQYTMEEYSVSVEVPETTEVHLTPDKGQEMQFNIYFVDSGLSFRGYVQVWLINDLSGFLSKSKSLSPFDFISYNITNIASGSSYGYQEDWTAKFGEKHISALEYWLTMNDHRDVLRISFFTDSTYFPDELINITQHIVSSLEIDISSEI